MSNIKGSGHLVILLFFTKDAAQNGFTGAYPLVCSTCTSACLLTSQHQTPAPTRGPGCWQLSWAELKIHLPAGIGSHTPALEPGSTWLPNFIHLLIHNHQKTKLEDMKSRGEEVQSHTWFPLGQTSLEEALQNMCTWSADGSSSQFHLEKLPWGNADTQNDALD